MQLREVAYALEDGVATVTLDRPNRLNAFTKHMQVELCQVFDEIDGDPAVRAVVVTGAGRGFCAGADLGGGEATFDTDNAPAEAGMEREADGRHRDEGGLVTLRIFRLDQAGDRRDQRTGGRCGRHHDAPDGRAAGVDVGDASASCSPAGASCPRRARRGSCRGWWASAGRWSGARPAGSSGPTRRWPAVWSGPSTNPTSSCPAAYALAREIADTTSGVSVAVTRALLWRMLGAPHPMDAHRLDSAFIDELGAGPEAREGVMSFLEKRPPHFPGSGPRRHPRSLALVDRPRLLTPHRNWRAHERHALPGAPISRCR